MSKITPRQATEAFNVGVRESLSLFTRAAFATVDPGTEYLHNWHIDCLSEALMACYRREIKRLIINIPPRYMKSICVTTAFPAWLLGKNPSERILAASYAQSLSVKHSVDCRLIIQSSWYRNAFPEVVITDDQNEKMSFDTTKRGGRIATSVGGSATGMGGNVLIVDDPHNPLQAASDVQRIRALEWFDQTFMSRLNNKQSGVVIVVMQRLHDDDLTGHLLKKGGWDHLCLPAIAEKRTLIQIGRFKKERELGHILHPERENKEKLEEVMVDFGSYGFAAQYQQTPVPSEGGMVKESWFKRYFHLPEAEGQIVQSWDTAIKASELNDFSVCTTWMILENGYYLVDVWCKRVEYPELKKQVAVQAAKYSPNTILIEDKGSGQSLIQDFRSEGLLPIIGINPTQDKVTRLASCSALIEAGKVLLPEKAVWIDDFITECITFPLGSHDDQVDSMSQFLNWTKERAAKTFRIRTL